MFEFTHRRRIVSLALGAAAVVALASTGCVTHHYTRGPVVYSVKAPPRSPAHGYVHRHENAVLVFDRSWKGYAVRSHPGHYFYSNYYYRWNGSRWQRARHLRGPWAAIEVRAVPAGLRNRHVSAQRRDDNRGKAVERPEVRREALKERRGVRREVAESNKNQRLAKASAVSKRTPAAQRRTKVRTPEDGDEEHPADHRAR
jgi:hypothetical protein